MGFSDTQLNALRRKLDPAHIRTRQIQDREIFYIEGWHAIAEANRIFGFDGWDRETTETKCVQAREIKGSLHAVYLAKVRISVRAEDTIVVREGFGIGTAQGPSVGETHEKALKSAETDATKRALATFGKPFGLSLYVTPRHGDDLKSTTLPLPDRDRRRTAQRLGPNGRYYVPHYAKPVLDPALMSPNEEARTAMPSKPSAPLSPEQDNREPQSEPNGGPPSSLALSDASPLVPTAPGLLIDWAKRHRDPAHLKFVASHPCLVCGRIPSDAHHLRFAQPRAMGRKVSDEFTVPLCRTHHRQLHQTGNEMQWWEAWDRDVDPLEIAKGFWEQSRNGPEASTTFQSASVDRNDKSSEQ